MNVEITDACNLRCAGCYRPAKGTTFMSVPVFRFIAKRLRAEGREQLAPYWRGEPCLHPNLPEIVEVSKELGFKKVRISTNTAVPNLHDADYVSKLLLHLNKMVVCVDGYDQTSLERYRAGASWDMTLKNVEAIGKVETNCVREMRVLMFKYNDGHEDFYRKLATENNFDYVAFVSPIIKGILVSEAEVKTWMSVNPKFQRYEKTEKQLWKLKRKESCTARSIIAVTGDLHPCCSDWDLKYPLGSVITKSLGRVRRGEKRKQLLPRLKDMKLPMCKKWCCAPLEPVVFREDLS